MQENLTLQKAVEISDGHILNGKTLLFQRRAQSYPHAVCQTAE